MPWNTRFTLLAILASVAITIALSALLWFVFHLPVLIGFLFLPFLFYGARMFGRREHDEEAPAPQVKTCPRCGWQTTDEEARYCARDQERLV